MASTTANLDINILADLTLDALMIKLDEAQAFSLGVSSDVNVGDSVKVLLEKASRTWPCLRLSNAIDSVQYFDCCSLHKH